MQETPTSLPRRHLLVGSASALAGVGLATWTQGAVAQAATAKPLPAFVSWKDASALIVHSSSTLETKRSAFGTSVITPSEQLFIRNNLNAPDASILDNRDAWTVSIEGVKSPRELSVAELKTLGIETVAMVLQCSGNGRGFFPHKPSGTPWTVGAAGCVVWSGVPLKNVVQALGGLADGARYITGTGGEKIPDGVDPNSVKVERSVPIAALEDALLAWELNGSPISLAHGGPLRLIVPGYTGVNNIKYVKTVAFTPKETTAGIMANRYRVSPVGTKATSEHESVLGMNVKSWINGPLPEDGNVKAGRVQIHGVAFGGIEALRGVEVSLDGGKTWQAARLVGPDLGKYAWRQFVFSADLKPGTYTLASRATDAKGTVQPEQRVENQDGYNNNSWRDHAVQVTVA
ncbi:sulfite oxidase [Caldimonas caldifontis]|uniref:Sulfite oxidase n=1 Tax=Caldimonas caldifontis TaxID=1452508 RepID=A0A2S5SWS8_9BURK|nr:sulfite oxidase [Caldimonas caldifontis]PPE67215.1 sulfite oxidase [Caldimonas caldifontis]